MSDHSNFAWEVLEAEREREKREAKPDQADLSAFDERLEKLAPLVVGAENAVIQALPFSWETKARHELENRIFQNPDPTPDEWEAHQKAHDAIEYAIKHDQKEVAGLVLSEHAAYLEHLERFHESRDNGGPFMKRLNALEIARSDYFAKIDTATGNKPEADAWEAAKINAEYLSHAIEWAEGIDGTRPLSGPLDIVCFPDLQKENLSPVEAMNILLDQRHEGDEKKYLWEIKEDEHTKGLFVFRELLTSNEFLTPAKAHEVDEMMVPKYSAYASDIDEAREIFAANVIKDSILEVQNAPHIAAPEGMRNLLQEHRDRLEGREDDTEQERNNESRREETRISDTISEAGDKAANVADKLLSGMASAVDGILDFICGAVPKTNTPPTPEEKAARAEMSQADIMRELFEMGRQTDEERAAAATREDDNDRDRGGGRGRGR